MEGRFRPESPIVGQPLYPVTLPAAADTAVRDTGRDETQLPSDPQSTCAMRNTPRVRHVPRSVGAALAAPAGLPGILWALDQCRAHQAEITCRRCKRIEVYRDRVVPERRGEISAALLDVSRIFLPPGTDKRSIRTCRVEGGYARPTMPRCGRSRPCRCQGHGDRGRAQWPPG
jgi:hypothetical protein